MRERRADRGAAMVEFALILPVFALMILILVEGSLRFTHAAQLRNWAFIAARAEAVHLSPTAAVPDSEFPDSEITVTAPGCTGSDPAVTTTAKVTITDTYSGLSTGLFPSSFIDFTNKGVGYARCDG